MPFWNESYQAELNKISDFIDQNLINYNEIPDDLHSIDDSVFADSIIVVSWRTLKNLYKNRLDLLDKYTHYNQKFLEQGNIPSLQELITDKFYFLNKVLRILFEYSFWASDDFGRPMFLRPTILERLDRLNPPSEIPVSFIWIERSMPAALTKDLLLSEQFSTLRMIAGSVGLFEEQITREIKRGISDVNKEADILKKDIEGLIKSASASVQSLAEYDDKLKQYKSEYNFVLLSKAFSNLLKTKKSEYVTNHRSVIIFSSWLIATPLLALLNHIYNFFPVEFNLNALFYFLPILSLELLFFYFMRLYYIEGKAIKAQMLQIEQRLSLCEFIHDYVETKNNSGAEKESWSLFEKLIFSPIQVTSENIPSLLDGASSIAELAGKVLSKDSK
ncbi:Uncharacterised protein [Klebsiella variicola]|uniref:hypothetical protein n=2 Tax=Klebsiella/Raoultella group TaxID=2890311 RepID=UPI000C29C502|nr:MULTISPECIES: hypothetical protein [Klebsiella]PJX30501.1 hypothetical protein CWM53_20300 [Klebsiella sp. A-Nf5]PJX40630.1 hypothetical protein CWM62_22875 [Klebsiella sp. C-Nf10]PJX51200.1 hypothetical protein CWM54_24870 [Klebsiella sp. D-Nf1]SSN02381.1 Uncharacterised protein [Klebsiella variicola]